MHYNSVITGARSSGKRTPLRRGSKRELVRKSRFLEDQLRAITPVIKDEHPLSVKANQLFRRDFPHCRNMNVNVINSNRRDAFVFYHGEMYVTTGFLGQIRTEEEFEWLCGHELNHIDDHKRTRKLAEARTLNEYLGMARLEEYAGDLLSFLELNKRGKNPMAGIELLKRLSEGEKNGGPTHGDTLHRIINMFWVTRLVDLENIGAVQNPFGIKPGDITIDDCVRDVPNVEVIGRQEYSVAEKLTELDKVDFFGAIAVYSDILKSRVLTRRSERDSDGDLDVESDFESDDRTDDDKRYHNDAEEDLSKDETDNETDIDLDGEHSGDDFEEDYERGTSDFESETSEDDEDYSGNYRNTGNVSSREQDTNFDLITKQLFGKIFDKCYEVVERNSNTNEDKDILNRKAQTLAELVRTFTCGHLLDEYYYDFRQEEFIEMADLKWFRELGIEVLYPDLVSAFIEKIRHKLVTRTMNKTVSKQVQSKLKGMFGKHSISANADLELEERILSTEDKHELDALSDIVEDVDSSEDSQNLTFTDKFLRELKTSDRPNAVKRLYKMRPLLEVYLVSKGITHSSTILCPEGGIDYAIVNAYTKILTDIFKPDESFSDLLSAMIACRALNISPMKLDVFETDQYRDSPRIDLAQFKEIITTLRDRSVVSGAYKFAHPKEYVECESQLANIARGWLFETALETGATNTEFAELVKESFKAYDKTDPNAKLRKVLEKYVQTIDPESLSSEEQITFYYLSLFQDPITRDAIQERVLTDMLEGMDFDSCLRFVDSNIGNITSLRPLDVLVEDKARTVKQLRQLADVQPDIMRILLNDPEGGLGNLIALEHFQKRYSTDRLDILKGALDTKCGEEKLMGAIYSAWRNLTPEDKELFKNDKRNIMEKTQDLLDTQQLYAMDVKYRYAFLRVMLADAKEGVLVKPEYKRRLAKELLDELVQVNNERDSQVRSILETLLDSLIQQAPLELSYFTLVPMMLDNLFFPPESHSDRQLFVINYELDLIGFTKDKEKREEIIRRIFAGFAWRDDDDGRCIPEFGSGASPDWIQFCKKRGIIEESAEEIITNFSYFYDHLHSSKKDRSESENQNQENTGSAKQSPLDVFRSDNHNPKRKKMEVLEFVCECAKNLGSPGVRFLQLLGQYANLPEEYQKDFQRVYDGIKGQSKLTAFTTLQREMPDVDERVSRIEEMVGGGSLTTVYAARLKDGKKVVIKVLNPNINYFNDIAFRVIGDTLTNLSATDPRFNLGTEIIGDIKSWVEGDINFTGFLEKDEEFRTANDGFEGVKGYSILVPCSYGPENKFYKIEDYIEGTNLTQFDALREQGHDVKAVVATIAKNYFVQLNRGRLHSDVHPGNFRVTDDRKVAILDRNYFLEIDAKDRNWFKSAAMYLMLKNARGLASSVVGYASGFNGNGHDLEQVKSEVQKTIEDSFESDKPMTVKLLDVVRTLRSNGLKLPLRTTLLIRNMHSLQKFAEDAGFDSLEQAIRYK